jgi:hypothetical protein
VIVPLPPVGAEKRILIEDASITVAMPIVGAFVFVVFVIDELDAIDVPVEFVAVTVNV